MVSLWELMVVASETKALTDKPEVISITSGTTGASVHLRDEAFDAFFPFEVEKMEMTDEYKDTWVVRSIKIDGVTFRNFRRKTDAE